MMAPPHHSPICARPCLWRALVFAATLAASVCFGQGPDAATLLNPPRDSWPAFHGDYTGRHFSPLDQISRDNARMLTLAWAFQTGVATSPPLKSTPLVVDGTIYITEPDDVWAIDARSGRQRWHYHYRANQGLHIGQRGVGIYKGRLYFETPDAHLLCLDARNGELRWDAQLADVKLGYWATTAPLIVRDHVIAGVAGDFNDLHGFLKAFNPETGKLEWQWDALPKPGEAGSETWPAASDAIRHGGGMTWLTGTYDPELNLLYWGTGNPNPVLSGNSRPGDNLYTCSIVALSPDTGKLVWHFQPSPHDVHDWDAVQTPMLVDAPFGGQPRKLLIQASRNGYLVVLDRTNGKPLLTTPFEQINWSDGVDAQGRPLAKADKYPKPEGTLVEPDTVGSTNWMAPSFNPQTGLVYVSSRRSFSLYYDMSAGKPEGFAGRDFAVWARSNLKAIDYQTGRKVWEHDLGPGHDNAGVLSTAGGLVFTADTFGNVLALDARTGATLWHFYGGGGVETPPVTVELDGRQMILVGSQQVLYAFALPEPLLHKTELAPSTP